MHLRVLLAALACFAVSGAASAQPKTPPAQAPAAAPAKKSPRAARGKKKDVRVRAPGGPVATLPGFKMLEGGGSRVFVEVSRKVDVGEHKAEGRLVYTLKGAAVPVRTNRLPFFTTFFPTQVAKVQLVEEGDDANLVIDLRGAGEATHRVLETENGMVLEVELPKPERIHIDAAAVPAAKAEPAATRKTETTTLQSSKTSDTAY